MISHQWVILTGFSIPRYLLSLRRPWSRYSLGGGQCTNHPLRWFWLIHVYGLDIESPHRGTLADFGFGLPVGPKAPNLVLDNEKRKESDVTAQRSSMDRWTRHSSRIGLPVGGVGIRWPGKWRVEPGGGYSSSSSTFWEIFDAEIQTTQVLFSTALVFHVRLFCRDRAG